MVGSTLHPGIPTLPYLPGYMPYMPPIASLTLQQRCPDASAALTRVVVKLTFRDAGVTVAGVLPSRELTPEESDDVRKPPDSPKEWSLFAQRFLLFPQRFLTFPQRFLTFPQRFLSSIGDLPGFERGFYRGLTEDLPGITGNNGNNRPINPYQTRNNG